MLFIMKADGFELIVLGTVSINLIKDCRDFRTFHKFEHIYIFLKKNKDWLEC